MLHRRYAPQAMRAELLERYRAIPLPTKSDEHWRFTDLAGLRSRELRRGTGRRRRLGAADDARDRRLRCRAASARTGITIEHAPEGIRFELLTDDHPLLGTLVGHNEKFAAHNAAMWEHGLLVHVPKGVVLDKPLYIRIANTVEGGSLFWRLLIVAEAQSRFTVIEEYASASPELSGYSNAAVEIVVEDGAKVEYVSVQNLLAEHLALRLAPRDGRARRGARLGRRRLRLGRWQGVDPERPRRPGCDVAGDRRVLRRPRAASRLRHVPGAHRAQHDLRLRLQGRASRHGERRLARDDPRRGRARRRRTPTRRTATSSSRRRPTRTRSRASRSSPTTCAAPTARRSARSIASSSSTRWHAGSRVRRPSG